MNYNPIVLAFSAAATSDGAAVNLLVSARAETGFNPDAFRGQIELMLVGLIVDGIITEGTAKTRKSMINKLATCEVDVLIDGAAHATGLSAVYKYVCDNSPKTSTRGAKKKTDAVVSAAPVETAPGTLADVLLIMQNIRNVILPKMTSDMGLLEDCDAFVATLRAKCGAGKAAK